MAESTVPPKEPEDLSVEEKIKKNAAEAFQDFYKKRDFQPIQESDFIKLLLAHSPEDKETIATNFTERDYKMLLQGHKNERETFIRQLLLFHKINRELGNFGDGIKTKVIFAAVDRSISSNLKMNIAGIDEERSHQLIAHLGIEESDVLRIRKDIISFALSKAQWIDNPPPPQEQKNLGEGSSPEQATRKAPLTEQFSKQTQELKEKDKNKSEPEKPKSLWRKFFS